MIRLGQHDRPVGERRRPVDAPGHGERPGDHAEIEAEDERRHDRAERNQARPDEEGQGGAIQRAPATGDHHVAPPADPEALGDEEAQGGRQQRRGHQRRAAYVAGSVDAIPRLGCQQREVAADDQRVGEVGENEHRDQQGGAGDRRSGERKRDGAENGEAAAAEIARGNFELGRRRRQDALDGKSGIGEVGQRLDRPQASPPEDADFQPRQTMGDQPEAAEHQQVGES